MGIFNWFIKDSQRHLTTLDLMGELKKRHDYETLMLLILGDIQDKPAFLRKFIKDNIAGYHFSANPAKKVCDEVSATRID